MSSFRTTLLASAVCAGLAVVGQLVFAMTFSTRPEWAVLLSSRISLGFCLLCVVLFVVGLFRFRLRGRWFALPVIVAFALPAYVVIDLTKEMDACLKRADHPVCVP
jgi:hypothetical protein